MKKITGTTVLYISYDGLLEPLGESQVLQYLRGLAKTHRIYLITFEKPTDWACIDRRRDFLRNVDEYGIKWIPLKYHKKPAGLSTTYDIVHGLVLAIYLTIRYQVEIIHTRSYVPSVIGLFMKRLFGVKFVFDMRGFWPDERLNAGMWRSDSAMYKVAKWFEKRFLLSADIIVSLTESAVKEMSKKSYLNGRMRPYKVIPTCVNTSLFKSGENYSRNVMSDLGTRDSFVLGCVGSVGGWFQFDHVLDLFMSILKKQPKSKLLILNRDQKQYILERIKKKGIPDNLVTVKSVDYADVHNEMAAISVGVFFYKPSYSEHARSPTKMAEFLACGIPCITNHGIGDTEEIIKNNGVGYVINEFLDEEFDAAASEILDMVKSKSLSVNCVKTAEKYFSLSKGIQSYDDVYNSLMCQKS